MGVLGAPVATTAGLRPGPLHVPEVAVTTPEGRIGELMTELANTKHRLYWAEQQLKVRQERRSIPQDDPRFTELQARFERLKAEQQVLHLRLARTRARNRQVGPTWVSAGRYRDAAERLLRMERDAARLQAITVAGIALLGLLAIGVGASVGFVALALVLCVVWVGAAQAWTEWKARRRPLPVLGEDQPPPLLEADDLTVALDELIAVAEEAAAQPPQEGTTHGP